MANEYSIPLSETSYILFSKLNISPFSLKMQGSKESLWTWKIAGFSIGCCDRPRCSGLGTRIWNLSDRAVELQIRVGPILKKVHTLKPGGSKRVKFKSIYKAYYFDETSQPYVWIHEMGGGSLRMVKQQYLSLDDLRHTSEIRIFRDHQRGCLSVRKKTRPDFC